MGGAQMQGTGVASKIAMTVVTSTGISDIRLLTYFSIVFTIFMTEFVSNLASIAMMCPIIINISLEIMQNDLQMSKEELMVGFKDDSISPWMILMPTIAVPFAAVCAFMTPWSSPMNAMAYGTGHVPLPRMLKNGFTIDVLCSVAIWLVLQLVPLIW